MLRCVKKLGPKLSSVDIWRIYIYKSYKYANIPNILEGISSREFWTYVQHKIDIFTQNTNMNFIKGLIR